MSCQIRRFVALDVEIASRSPIRICALGLARYEDGQEVGVYRSLVRVDGPVYFGRVHGLTRRDLVHAPDWSTVWMRALDVLGDVTVVVAFRASFDRGAILAMSARHGVRIPRLRFVCVAELLRARHGLHGTLASSLQALGLDYPGQPHEPLADARAAALAALACSRDND